MVDFALRWLSRDRLSVFLFHAVPQTSPQIPQDFTLAQFEETLHFIKRHFSVLPLDEAVTRMVTGRLPPRSACITFDDGYPSWVTGVGPLLQKEGVPATFYITTGQFCGLPMWHERVAHAINAFKGRTLDIPGFGLPPLPMQGLHDRRRAFAFVEQFLKYQSLSNREALMAMLERSAGVTPRGVPCMTETQLRELVGMGFGIGAHTNSHPILTLCDREQALQEIGSVRETLSAMLRCPVDSFAYPNGRPWADFDCDHVQLVRQAGYRHAVTTDWGAATPQTSPYEIPRFTPWGPTRSRMAVQVARNLLIRPRAVVSAASARPRKVLVVENGAGFGGAVIALKSLLDGMEDHSADFHVASNMPVPGLESLPAVRSMTVISDRRFDARKRADALRGVRTAALRTALQFGLGRMDDMLNRLPFFLRLLWLVAKLKPDIVHGNNEPNSNREALLVARLLRIPYVQHVRGPLSPTRLAPWLLKVPAAFVPVSRWLAGELLVRGVPSHRIRQVYDGVDMNAKELQPVRDLRADLRLSPQTKLVAMVGMFVYWKGQDLFIEAVSRLSRSGDPVAFLLFGDTPEHGDADYARRLQGMVKALGLEQRVHFMGRQVGLHALMDQLDVVVSASTEPEPLGLVMIEAMSRGCIFVAPAFGAATEVVEDGTSGFLFRPHDADDLAIVLEKAICASGSHSEMSALARQRVLEQFSTRRCQGDTLRVYKTVPIA